MSAKRSGAGVVLESLRNGKWVLLCAECPMPRTKMDDPEVPALVWTGKKWKCPECGYTVTEKKLWESSEDEFELE